MNVAVVLLTYNRLEYAKRTVECLVKHLHTETHQFRWHIASDGDSYEYLDALMQLLAGKHAVTISNSMRGGYGRNYNLAMQVAHLNTEWILPVEDDWELLRPLNVDPVIDDMAALGIGCARLGYLGYTQALRGEFIYGKRCGHWLSFDPTSPEPHVFAGHPRIECVTWAKDVGPWPEGALPGDTEFAVAHRAAARHRVAWPLDVVKPSGDLFAHIGTVRSW